MAAGPRYTLQRVQQLLGRVLEQQGRVGDVQGLLVGLGEGRRSALRRLGVDAALWNRKRGSVRARSDCC